MSASHLPDDALVRQAIVWMVRLQSDSGDAQTQQACQRWRQAHPDRERAWQRAEQVGQTLRGHFHTLPQGSGAPAFDALQAAATRVERRRTLARLCVALGVGVPSAWMAREHTPWQRLVADHSTALGERRDLLLPDGTRLQLNTDTAVQVRFDAGQRLVVLMRGEVALTSGADAGAPTHRPLRVQCQDGLCEALGTRFTVRQRTDSSRVSVQEGRVALRPADGLDDAAPVIAPAGSSYDLTRTSARPAALTGLDESGWTDGVLAARDMRLGDFLAEVGRYRRGHIACDDAVAGLRLSGVYRLDDTHELLELLPRVIPVRVSYATRYWVRVGPA